MLKEWLHTLGRRRNVLCIFVPRALSADRRESFQEAFYKFERRARRGAAAATPSRSFVCAVSR
jgi:hypothetical protein